MMYSWTVVAKPHDNAFGFDAGFRMLDPFILAKAGDREVVELGEQFYGWTLSTGAVYVNDLETKATLESGRLWNNYRRLSLIKRKFDRTTVGVKGAWFLPSNPGSPGKTLGWSLWTVGIL
jgi:hypothetical protein